MESLAYLHYALAYETSGSSDPIPSVNVGRFFQQLNWHKCSSTVGFWFLWLATTLAVLSIFNNTLAQTFGEQNEQVRELQQRLFEFGYITSNNITGFFGPITRDALRRFKRDFNLPISDDNVDPQTAEALGLRRVVQTQSTNVSTIGANVRRGNIGSAVSDLQRRLRDLGYYFGSVDGDFGPSTETAVIQFQQNNGLRADGIVGPATWNVLLSGIALRAPVAAPSPIDRLPPPPPTPVRSARTTVSQSALRSSTFGNITTLRRGDRSTEVFDLQTRLNECGFNSGPEDGIFGSRTEEAVRQYQRTYQLFPVDGIARQDIIIALRSSRCSPQITQLPSQIRPLSSTTPYVVVIPQRGNNTINQVLAVKSNAFLTRNKLGWYINAGAYNNRASAESESYRLRDRGLDARVVYFKR